MNVKISVHENFHLDFAYITTILKVNSWLKSLSAYNTDKLPVGLLFLIFKPKIGGGGGGAYYTPVCIIFCNIWYFLNKIILDILYLTFLDIDTSQRISVKVLACYF